MNLETRKLEFIKAFLKLKSEDIISRLEAVLKTDKEISKQNLNLSMSEEELNRRIDASEADFISGDFKSSAELLDKYN